MEEFKKLFQAKRILALILAAAMIVTMLPETAFAASMDAVETESVTEETESVEIESKVEMETPEASTVEEEKTVANEVSEPETSEMETPKTEGTETETKTETDGTTATQAEEVTSQEEVISTETVEDISTETVVDISTETVEETSTGTDETVVTAEEAKDVYILNDNLSAEQKTAVYSRNDNPFTDENGKVKESILSAITLRKEGKKRAWKLNDYTNELVGTVTYQWKQKGTDNNYANMAENAVPKDAGAYQLLITLPAKENTYDKVELTVDFTITKAPVTITFQAASVTPGSTKADVKLDYVSAEASDKQIFYWSEKEADSELKCTLTVKDAITDKALDTEKLVKNKDYIISIAVEFTDKVDKAVQANYEIQKCDSQAIVVGDLKESRVELNLTDTWKDKKEETVLTSDDGKKITKITAKAYDGNAASLKESDDYTVKVVEPVIDAEGKETLTEITDAKTTGTWHTAVYKSWEESKTNDEGNQETVKYSSLTIGGELESAPVEAGTYVYRVAYAGEEGLYEDSYADLVVEIEKVEAVIIPAIKDNKFYKGVTAKDVLAKVSYNVYNTKDTEHKTPIKVNFGTSYVNNTVTQSYEPVFEVVETIKDKDGKVIGETELKATDKLGTSKAKEGISYTYTVRFSGKKAVYRADGTLYEYDYLKGINDSVDSTSENYFILDDEAACNANAVTLEMADAKLATIDTSKIKAGLGEWVYTENTAFHNAITTTYEYGKYLFNTRKAYKQAEVKYENSVLSADNYPLTYKWYRYDNYSEVARVQCYDPDETDFSNIDNWTFKELFVSPSEAGIYKLVISMEDKSAEYYAEPAEVYFVIEKQQIRVVPTGTYSALIGMDIDEFLRNIDVANSVQKLPNNTGSEWIDTNWVEYKDYDVDWRVVEEITKEDGTKEYETRWGEFQEGKTYKLAVEGFWLFGDDDINYTSQKLSVKITPAADANEEAKRELVSEDLNDSMAEIKVDKMGNTVIKLNTDKIIEKSKVYDGTAIDLTTELAAVKAVKEDGSAADVVLDIRWYDAFEWDCIAPERAVNAGTYEIYASYKGDTTYKALKETKIAEATITPKELIISPVKLSGVKAGTYADEIANNLKNLDISGYTPADSKDFTYQFLYYDEDEGNNIYGYPAWVEYYLEDDGNAYYENDSPELAVYDSKGNKLNAYGNVLKGSGSYTLRVESTGDLRGIFERNYTVTAGSPASIGIVRGNASVSSSFYPEAEEDWDEEEEYYYNTDNSTIAKVDTKDSINGMEHLVSFHDGIAYSHYDNNDEKKIVYGNFVAVRIAVPSEYEQEIPSTAVYENEIKKAGGYIAYAGSGYILAIFDAAVTVNPTFSICWEDGYIEKFELDFANAVKLGNLREAVEPKSIAFNAPKTKMVVGEIQDLDVKLTKAQMGDVICLAYNVVSGGVHVSEYGRVTALSAGPATIEVYPVKLVDGKKVKIGTKKASVKITVSEVAAPKITKVIPADQSVAVQYPYIADTEYYTYGYRREIYVLEGNTWKDTDFEEKISGMVNGQWEAAGFAVEPVFLTPDYEDYNRIYDSKGKLTNTVEYTIEGLKHSKAYTVYVRNVNAVRTLLDGSKVTESAKGSVKAFQTTLPQISDLESELKDREESKGNSILGDAEQEKDNVYYDVPLSDGKVSLSVTGVYEALALDKNAETYEDKYDAFLFPLPLDREIKKQVIEPKLAYYFASVSSIWDDEMEEYVDEYRYSASSDYASIDKKGNITLKQPGKIYVCAVDTTTRLRSNFVVINITAKADSMQGKTTNLQVGQSIRLDRLANYKSGGKVLSTLDFSSNLVNDDALKSAVESGGYFELTDNYVTAVKPGGSISFDLEDDVIGTSARVTIKSKALDPIKNLKMMDVIDKQFVIQFEPSIYAEGYRIEVTNARGTLVRSAYVENDYNYYYYLNYKDKEDDDFIQGNWHIYWDFNARKYYCEYTMKGLTQQSKYNVKVTALYGDVSSKTVAKAVTTTKMPAWDYGLAAGVLNKGIRITTVDSINSGYDDDNCINDCTFISGNSYTLIAFPSNWSAQYAVTDKLTWTSSDKKVATVKATAGTYSATLKAVRAGKTTIEVKSGITKKVIARYIITISTVGDAYTSGSRYYGDNEDLRGDEEANEEPYTELIAGRPAAVELTSGQCKWFAFTATEKAAYQFYKMVNGNKDTYGVAVYTAMTGGSYLGVNPTLEKGKTVYIKVTADGTYTLNVQKQMTTNPSDRIPLELNKSETMNVKNGQWFVFTAPKEGFYSFEEVPFYRHEDLSFYLYEDIDGSSKASGNPVQYQMKRGQTVYLKVNNVYESEKCTITVKEITVSELTADSSNPYKVSKDQYSWYSFTAPQDAEYEFVTDGGNYKVLSLYAPSDLSMTLKSANGYSDVSVSYMLGKGETVWVRVSHRYESDEITLAVKTKSVIENITTEQAKTVTLLGGV